MAKEKLQIILDALWKGGAAVQESRAEFRRSKQRGLEKVQANWKKLAGGAGIAGVAIAGLGAAAKLAFDGLQRGAALDLAVGQFDKLTESIGSTSDAMLGRLQQAGRGSWYQMPI